MKKLGLLHGMYGSMEAEFEAQRTIERAELTAFLCFLTQVIGAIEVPIDNQRNTVTGYGEEKEIAPIRKLAMLTCGSRFGKSCVFQCPKEYV